MLARIGARHEIAAPSRWCNVENRNGVAVGIGIGLAALQALEGVAGGRHIATLGIEKTEHLIERAILQHQDNHVLNLVEHDSSKPNLGYIFDA